MNKEIKPCPICGKKPKFSYYFVDFGSVICAPFYYPFFGKPHLSSGAIYSSPHKLEDRLIYEWNKAVDKYNNEQNQTNGGL